MAESNTIVGTVKFFSPQRGYGFIQTGDGDALVLRSSLVSSGIEAIFPGEKIECHIQKGRHGILVNLVVRVISEERATSSSAKKYQVDWYCRKRGFGFLTDGTRQVYVHAETVKKSGFVGLSHGQMLIAEVAPSRNGGLEAVDLWPFKKRAQP